MVFLTRGAQVNIDQLKLTMEESGALKGTMELQVGFDVYPHWAAHASNCAKLAREAGAGYDIEAVRSGQESELAKLHAEVAATMGTIAACWSAVDSFYGSILSRMPPDHAPPKVEGRPKRNRQKRMASIFEQRFDINPIQREAVDTLLGELENFRGLAVHSNGDPRPPAIHPRIGIAVAVPIAMYRHENATQSVHNTFELLGYLIAAPKPKYEKLVEHCEHARSWLYPIFDEWEKFYMPLTIKRL